MTLDNKNNHIVSAIEVGKCYEVFKINTDGSHIEFTDSGIILYLHLIEPTYLELKSIRESRVSARFDIIKNVMMFAFRFGNSIYFDAPFSPHLYNEELSVENVPDGEGYSLTIILADSKTGEVKNISLLSLSNQFSNDINKAISNLMSEPFNEKEYDKNLDDIYDNYSIEDIYKNSKCSCSLR